MKRKANVAFVCLSTVACNRNVLRTGLPSSPGGEGERGVVQRRHVSPEVSSLVLFCRCIRPELSLGSPPSSHYHSPICTSVLSLIGYTAWRNWFLGIDSWAP